MTIMSVCLKAYAIKIHDNNSIKCEGKSGTKCSKTLSLSGKL